MLSWTRQRSRKPRETANAIDHDHLALDEDVVLAGFSMGTGEVTRYLGTHGSAGVSKAVLIRPIPPSPGPPSPMLPLITAEDRALSRGEAAAAAAR